MKCFRIIDVKTSEDEIQHTIKLQNLESFPKRFRLARLTGRPPIASFGFAKPKANGPADDVKPCSILEFSACSKHPALQTALISGMVTSELLRATSKYEGPCQ